MNADDLRTLLSDSSRQAVEEWCRSRARAVPMGHRVLCRALGKYSLFVDPEDDGMAPHLALDGFWEIWVTQAIARTVKTGMTVLDVGAAYGYYAVLLADLVGDTGSAHAWEPNWMVQSAYLSANLGLNGATRVTCVHCEALGAAAGTAALVPGGRNLGGAAVRSNLDGADPGTVTVQPLDGLGLHRVDFVKIDAEGSEPAIWQGARATFGRSPAVTVCMEWTPGLYNGSGGAWDGERLLHEIQADGFKLAALGSDGRPEPASPRELLQISTNTMLWLTRSGS